MLTAADYGNSPGSAIATRSHTVGMPLSNADFTGIDVTDELRRDLFGAGTGDTSSGFILIAAPGHFTGAFFVSRFQNVTIHCWGLCQSSSTPFIPI